MGTETAPTVEKCHFSKNKLGGIFALNGAFGTFTDCESRGNDLGLVLKDRGTNPKAERCRMVKNNIGIYIMESAQGVFRNNILMGNEKKNWYIEKNCFPVRFLNIPNE